MVEITSFESFFQLKLLCNSLLEKNEPPTVQIVKDICGCIENLPTPVLQNLVEYILLPTISHLEYDIVSHDVKLHLLNVIDMIVQRVRIMKMNLFKNIYIVLLRRLHNEKQPAVVITGHEELKLRVMHCLGNLFSRASMNVIELLYTRENSLKLSQSFFICIFIAKHEKYSALRIAAIETLMILSCIHDGADTNDSVLRSQVADIVMLYLPGIIRAMLDICQGQEIQNHKVTLMAIRTLGRVIALIMEDIPNKYSVFSFINGPDKQSMLTTGQYSDPLKLLELQAGVKEKKIDEYLKTVVRNQEWLDAVSGKLCMPIKILKSLTKHPHSKVREELAKIVHLLLMKCPKNININFPKLVDIIIILSEDNVHDVRVQATNFLDEITHNIIENYRMRPIIALLEEKLYKLLIKFPRIIRSSDDTTQLVYLNQLQGYLKMLGRKHFSKIMNSIMHLQRLLLAFVYVLELNYQDVSVLDDDDDDDVDVSKTLKFVSQVKQIETWKKFKFIQDLTVQNKVIVICKMLGELGDFDIVVDAIFELMSSIPNYQKELILLLNWISMGQTTATTTTTTVFLPIYEQIINYYISYELWSLPLTLQDDIPLCEIQSNILKNCLLTEGLGIFAQMLQSDYQQQFLLMTLYLIIERAGSKNRLISLVGLHTLQKYANSLGYKNIENLLRENMDYISYHITMKVRKLERNIEVLDVVRIIMKYCTLNVLPYLVEIVKQALSQLQVEHQRKNFLSILEVLYTFVICMAQQQDRNDTDLHHDSIMNIMDNADMDNVNLVIDSLREYCDAKNVGNTIDDNFSSVKIEENLVDEQNENRNKMLAKNNNGEEEIDVKPPSYIIIVEEVVRSSINFVPSKNIRETLLAMKIIENGVKILAPWTNQLLPLIHQLWFPLSNRFKQENLLIIKQAWQLLYNIAQVAKDFIRTQTFDEIIPTITKFLESSAFESYKKTSEGMYIFTQMFKLQENILSQFGLLAKYLKLNEKQLWKLLCITESYLNHYQHPVLQAACTELYKTISHLNRDIVWVKCLSIQTYYEKKNFTIQTKSSTIHSKNANECKLLCSNFYGENAQIILNYIHEMTSNAKN